MLAAVPIVIAVDALLSACSADLQAGCCRLSVHVKCIHESLEPKLKGLTQAHYYAKSLWVKFCACGTVRQCVCYRQAGAACLPTVA